MILATALLASVLSHNAAVAANGAVKGSDSAAVETSSDSDADFVATLISETAAANRQTVGTRDRTTDSGSLLLMEIRTHHGRAAAASAKAVILDLDPRTKPLGW